MLEILKDAIIDTLKLLPFLFITYLIMEYIEHKMSEKSKQLIKKSGKLGPFLGGIVGVVPQCGFSASATNLYAGRVISLGTLIAVYLSTSDEMIPIFISEAVPMSVIVKILLLKLAIGVFFGFVIDSIFSVLNGKKGQDEEIVDLCKHEHCHCEENHGILKPTLKHTMNISIYIFVITLIINLFVILVGEETIANFIGNHAVLGPVISSLVGLIPNCVASVIITNLYIQNIINGASMVAGLLTGAGVGLIVLFRMNRNIKENIGIIFILYGIGVLSGLILQLIGFSV